MPGRSLSSTAKAGVFAQETEQVYLVLLEIAHSSLGTPIRVVNNYADVVSNGVTYSAFPFEISLPDDTDEKMPNVMLSIDNVDRVIVNAIRSITGPPTITISVVLASSPSTIEAGPYSMTLREASYDAATVTGSLAVEDMLNEPYPSDLMTPANFPGLF